jgi:hypothetical protein
MELIFKGMQIFKNMRQLLLIKYTSVLFVLSSEPTYSQVITKESFRNKTLACIIGQMAGMTTGYEFERNQDGTPRICLPDNWFEWCRGTLGGSNYDQYNYATRNPKDGKVLSDDDLHIDFFNQYILNKYGIYLTEGDFRSEWLNHYVKDWGSGGLAMEIMSGSAYIPPFTGQRITVNYLCEILTEGWIEQETIGCNFPGMPNSAAWYARMAASLSSDHEALEWAELFPAMYAIAYFESDSRIVLSKAMELFHPDSWCREVYTKAKSIYTAWPGDWRTGMYEFSGWNSCGGHLYYMSDIRWQEKLDRNMGFAMLSILYGANDYTETVKIASLAGLDGDCTSASIAGLMGIIKGMDGTPPLVKTRIYPNNSGQYINDLSWGSSIGFDYPESQTIDGILNLYLSNAETMIQNLGGLVNQDHYLISGQKASNSGISIKNPGFEDVNLTGWTIEKDNANAVVFAEEQYNENGYTLSLTGKKKCTIVTSGNSDAALIYQKIDNLKSGSTYKITAGFYTASNRIVQLFARNFNHGHDQIYSSKTENVGGGWNTLTLFVQLGPTNTSMEIGMRAPSTSNSEKWCCADDFRVEICDSAYCAIYEAEEANLNHVRKENSYVTEIEYSDSYLEWDVNVGRKGRYWIGINYANGNGAGGTATQNIFVNGTAIGEVPMISTGSWGTFSRNIIEVPVLLNDGKNTIQLSKGKSAAEIDYIQIRERTVKTGGSLNTEIHEIRDKSSSKPVLFPNPVSDYLNILFDNKNKPFEIQIYDSNGKIILECAGQNFSHHLNVSNLNSGLYFVKVHDSKYQYVNKMVKFP